MIRLLLRDGQSGSLTARTGTLEIEAGSSMEAGLDCNEAGG